MHIYQELNRLLFREWVYSRIPEETSAFVSALASSARSCSLFLAAKSPKKKWSLVPETRE